MDVEKPWEIDTCVEDAATTTITTAAATTTTMSTTLLDQDANNKFVPFFSFYKFFVSTHTNTHAESPAFSFSYFLTGKKISIDLLHVYTRIQNIHHPKCISLPPYTLSS